MKTIHIRRLFCLALGALVFGGDLASAQQDVRDAIRDIRETGQGASARAILSQESAFYSIEVRRALADSLVAMAAGYRPTDSEARYEQARNALVSLASAGASTRQRPFEESVRALSTVYETSQDEGLRLNALWFMAHDAHRPEAIQYLAGVAVSGEPLGYYAVGLLGRDMEQPGLARLRQIYRDGLVTEERAREELQSFADAYNWGGG